MPHRLLFTAALALWLLLGAALGAAPAHAQGSAMKLRLHIDGQLATVTLDDTATARDFAALLPLTLTLRDYAAVERIADLPRKLSLAGAPAGHTPRAGELTYYAPWGNLAFFIEGNVHAPGLVRLGTVDTGLAALKRPGPFTVRLERATD